jgi:acylphosphatase
MSETGAVYLIVRGRVQGVCFRAGTQQLAADLGLTGWVKNCCDRSVEIHAEGARDKLEELVAWCRKGPPAAFVSNVDLSWVESEGLSSFDIR